MNNHRYYDRPFQVWSYTVSHGQLLLRSPKSLSNPTRVDILFKNTVAMFLPAAFESLTISRVHAQDLGLDETALGLKGKTIFRLRDLHFDGFVAAGAVVIHEDDREYDEPSEIYPT
jgi:hypothetical protein